MSEKIKVLAFAGSLRKGSFNKALIRAAVDLAPENIAIEVFDLEGIPPFNQEFEANPPQRVKDFKDKIRSADALLIATPEYNYSVSGVLKTPLTALQDPESDTPLEGKPVAIMSASMGRFGGARAQYHLRQSFIFLNMQPINRPEVMLSDAVHNVDANGNLTNEQTRALIRQLLEALAVWTIKLKQTSNKRLTFTVLALIQQSLKSAQQAHVRNWAPYMRVIADLHIHGRYSRATSEQMSIPEIAKYAKIKGLNLVGTGDFTHPKWLKEINETLTPERDTGSSN